MKKMFILLPFFCQLTTAKPSSPPSNSPILTSSSISSCCDQAYASASATNQHLMLSVATPITFDQKNISPNGIKHPHKGSFARFNLKQKGLYLISWTINLSWNDASQSAITLDLFDTTTNTSLFQTAKTLPATTTLPKDKYDVISGQTLLALKAGTVLELKAQTTNINAYVADGEFSIIQIGA